MHKNAATLLIVSVLVVMPMPLILPAKVTALPSPFIIAASIVGLVAIFGATFSLLLRKRGKKRTN
jgi:hypothetical protein